MAFQPPLPESYRSMSEADMADAITRHKARFGSTLVMLGHHYQQDNVVRFADFTGDSLKLSLLAAEQRDAQYVIFCGVHFMAESADIVTDSDVTVILPDLSAGCSMADMAAIDQLETAWERLAEATTDRIIPITYVNSTAEIKAFCGAHDGACCTSSNARLVLEWALERGDKVIFLPDQHLGRNTAYAMGFPLESMVVYDPHDPDGALSDEQIRDARFLLWKGHCSVHALFTKEQCDEIRAADPDCTIIVHPECTWDVVQAADLSGSTEYIIKTITDAPAGSRFAVGTEAHLVNRLTHLFSGEKMVRSLAGIQCLCTTMYRIDPPHLLWCLDQLAAETPVNVITVPEPTRSNALTALNRMLELRSAVPVAAK